MDVQLTGAQETLLITLYAKSFDFYSSNSVLGDKWAAETMEKITGKQEEMRARLKGTPTHLAGVALRALCLDTWASEFLAENECATVVHLACGLDSRALRLRSKCRKVRWIDLDMPDVVDLRRRLEIQEPESTSGYTYEMVGSSVTETAWLQHIPADRPTLIIFEGLSMYLEPSDGEDLVKRLTGHFPSGQLVFDCFPWATRLFLNTFVWLNGKWSVEFKWTISNPKGLEALHPGLELLDTLYMADVRGLNRLPQGTRTWMYLLSWIPFARSAFMYLRYKF
ncbi:putative polyketide synthase protein [Mariannaea sp. PMI_226]|nr:putative polyketide synthase protein [Mariannaea sp. PMI_226]